MTLSRPQIFGGIGVVALAAIALAAYFFYSGNRPADDRRSERLDLTALHQPGPLPDMAIGSGRAPVTIVEYASVTCPFCASFHIEVYGKLKTKYIDTGKVRWILREFPTNPVPVAIAGFALARCSGDKYFPLIDVIFEQQRSWASDPYNGLLSIAKQAGFSQQSFEACMKDEKLATAIQEVALLASRKFGVNSTPTFFINGQKLAGPPTIEAFEKQIEPLLKAN